jgi:uncharacterized membrane protein YbhN (UPF0104 family)
VARRLIVAAVAAVLVVAALGVYADFGALADAFADFEWPLLLVAFALTFVNYVVRFWRWELYLKRLDVEVPRVHNVLVFGVGLTMTLSPAKLGEVLKSALLRRAYGIPFSRTAPAVLVERITDALGIVVLAVVALAAAGSSSGWPVVVVVAAGAVALVAALRLPLHRRLHRLEEARSAALSLLGARLLLGTTLLSAAAWGFECVAAWVCVRGLGVDASLPTVAIVFTVASLAGAVSFVPGGLGVAEGSMTGLFQVLAGLARAEAVAATVLIRLATLWFAVLLGVISLPLETRAARR